MRKVLIANRGEIAVRIARACKDAGIASVAVYAEPDRDALHVRVADEAFALGGSTPGDSYLVIDKLLEVAAQAGADAVHPGYGFLAENAGFAQAVIDAGLTWIGPPPAAIDSLGDKVKARHIAERAGAPLVAGTKDPVEDADEVVAFAKEHGLPVAIKAAYGGGGRGLKVARTIEEIPELFDSAVREAVGAFGRGECFVEQYLDKPRHVETQCLADSHGNVVVVSTRDCSLQRRHQKLVEEAPAPFLSDEQNAELYRASKAILTEAGYVGAGTCEFLVGQDGTISFLEVNTRLQVEHPVTEEVTGIDLVREMFRIADGEELGYDDPELRGHSIEFRINGEDAGRNFLPAPGHVTHVPAADRSGGPARLRGRGGRRGRRRLRLDAGQADRHRRDPAAGARALAPGAGRVRRRRHADRAAVPPRWWWPTRRSPRTATSRSPSTPAGSRPSSTTPCRPGAARPPTPRSRASASGSSSRSAAGASRWSCRPAWAGPAKATGAARPARRTGGKKTGAAASGDALTSPMQGTIVKVVAEDGQQVEVGDPVVVLEAMKMEQPLTAHKAGTVTGLTAEVGATVTNGEVICEIKD